MSTPNPIVKAAAPELMAIIDALSAGVTAMGPDPLQWAVKWPGVLLSLQGAILTQLPTLATAEGGALQTEVQSTMANWVSKLKAL